MRGVNSMSGNRIIVRKADDKTMEELRAVYGKSYHVIDRRWSAFPGVVLQRVLGLLCRMRRPRYPGPTETH